MAVLDLNEDVWRKALNLPRGSEPSALILEGTWWREKATKARLSHLSNVREMAFPDIFMGEYQGVRVAYCCAYGAPRAAEPAHVFAQMGTPLLIQLGTSGAMVSDMPTGTVSLPLTCRANDGISQHYGAGESVLLDEAWIKCAQDMLSEHDVVSRPTAHITWPSLFSQSHEMTASWANKGLESVDMETSIVAAIAARFGASALSMLAVWDQLAIGKTFLDPLEPAQEAALNHAIEAVFDVALRLAKEVRPPIAV